MLLCPLTGEVLSKTKGLWHSSKVQYPSFFEVPWLYRHPESTWNHWRKKIQDTFDYSLQKITRAEEDLLQPDLLYSTRRRLQALIKGHLKFLELNRSMLGPIADGSSVETDQSLERIPRQQSAMAYQSTLFRDWVWGGSQIKAYADLLTPMLEGRKRMVYPGAGACGLPLEIHNRLKPEISLAVDINPFLVLPARRLLNGETLHLVEFPLVPKTANDLYVEQELKPKSPVAPGFEIIFADAQNLNLKPASVDAIVTSWFIDIIPRDFRELARLFNTLLPKDGVWANIGQLGFEKSDLSRVYGPDEILEILTESGFEVLEFKAESLPYLMSPHDAVGRQDSIWVFKAIKRDQAKRPAHHEYWPDWLNNPDEPVPLSPQVMNFRTRSQVYNFVIEQVDGQNSIRAIAKVLSQEFGIDAKEAESAVLNFFSNFFESQIYREF